MSRYGSQLEVSLRNALRILLVSLCFCTTLLADGPPAHAKKEPEPDPIGLNEPDQRAHILRMAKLYNVAPELIEQARIAGVGIGEIDVVLDIAKKAGVKPEEVIALKGRGTPWLTVTEKYGLKLEELVPDEDARTALIEGETALVTQLSERYSLSTEQVLGYRDQVADWGELRLALAISQKANVPVQELIDKAVQGHGWGTIAKEYKLNVGDLMRDPASRENFGGPETPHEPKKDPKRN